MGCSNIRILFRTKLESFRCDKEMGFVAVDRDACELVLKKEFAPKL
jgi:hypothetical protein